MSVLYCRKCDMLSEGRCRSCLQKMQGKQGVQQRRIARDLDAFEKLLKSGSPTAQPLIEAVRSEAKKLPKERY